jgi:hypothetical protein
MCLISYDRITFFLKPSSCSLYPLIRTETRVMSHDSSHESQSQSINSAIREDACVEGVFIFHPQEEEVLLCEAWGKRAVFGSSPTAARSIAVPQMPLPSLSSCSASRLCSVAHPGTHAHNLCHSPVCICFSLFAHVCRSVHFCSQRLIGTLE